MKETLNKLSRNYQIKHSRNNCFWYIPTEMRSRNTDPTGLFLCIPKETCILDRLKWCLLSLRQFVSKIVVLYTNNQYYKSKKHRRNRMNIHSKKPYQKPIKVTRLFPIFNIQNTSLSMKRMG